MSRLPSAVDFEQLVARAARAFAVPVALAGAYDGETEHVIATHGWQVRSFPKAYSFSSLFVDGSRSPIIAADTTQHPLLRSHPLVTGAPRIRFYAGVPLFTPDGKLAGVISVMDSKPGVEHPMQAAWLEAIAERIHREYAVAGEIEEANSRFREFFEQSSDLVLSISAQGALLHANETALSILGIKREELGRINIARVVDADVRERFLVEFATMVETGELTHIETTFVTDHGNRIVVEGSLQPRIVDGMTVLARVIFRDVTERRKIEAELGSARDAALEAARLKTQFLTNVSHEIRTPMNGIVGMIDLLLSTTMTEEQQDYAHQARSSAEQLLSIVNNILYVSNVEVGSLSTAAVDFDLNKTVQRIIEVMRIAALGKDVDVKYVSDPRIPSIVRGHQTRLRQVITNLMDNAIKFTEEGSVTLNVVLDKETETHRVVRFEVRDTGIGIAPEDRLLLFEKFSQVEASSTRRYEGMGLGLATARQLVETMGGIMDAESTPGFGSTFWFTIPFPKQTARRPIVSSDLDFKARRVLLVDSYATSRKIIHHYLERTWGMVVEHAANGQEALAGLLRAQAAGNPFRVLIFDTLPDFEPDEFARKLRAESRLEGLSLIFLAPAHSIVNEQQLRESGVNAYVAKPVGQGELFDAMTIALAQDAIPLARMVTQSPAPVAPPPPVPPEKRQKTRVLLAEDNFLNMKLTMSQLNKLGYQADSVSNGKEALEAIDAQHYHIILMDCQMPVLDGYQATIEIRRAEQSLGRRHRIIAMTANALEGDREKCLAAGMDDYLSKPTRAEELETALARYFVSS